VHRKVRSFLSNTDIYLFDFSMF